MKSKSTSKKRSPKDYAEALFFKTKKVFKDFHLTSESSSLEVMNAYNISLLFSFSLLQEVLNKKNNSRFLEKIIAEYHRLLGKVAYVKTATALTEKEKEALGERITSLFGKYYYLEIEVDPSLIGGLTVEAGDKVLDESVLGKINKLEKHFQE